MASASTASHSAPASLAIAAPCCVVQVASTVVAKASASTASRSAASASRIACSAAAFIAAALSAAALLANAVPLAASVFVTSAAPDEEPAFLEAFPRAEGSGLDSAVALLATAVPLPSSILVTSAAPDEEPAFFAALPRAEGNGLVISAAPRCDRRGLVPPRCERGGAWVGAMSLQPIVLSQISGKIPLESLQMDTIIQTCTTDRNTSEIFGMCLFAVTCSFERVL